MRGGHVVNSKGRLGLSSILIDNGTRIPADCLAVSGGWSPNVHLTCHHRSKPIWNDEIAAFCTWTRLARWDDCCWCSEWHNGSCILLERRHCDRAKGCS